MITPPPTPPPHPVKENIIKLEIGQNEKLFIRTTVTIGLLQGADNVKKAVYSIKTQTFVKLEFVSFSWMHSCENVLSRRTFFGCFCYSG